jgi:hypothetical protein
VASLDVKIEMEVTDTRTIKVPVPASQAETAQFARFIEQCASEDYYLKSITEIGEERGNQRDPYRVTTGLSITFERTP